VTANARIPIRAPGKAIATIAGASARLADRDMPAGDDMSVPALIATVLAMIWGLALALLGRRA